MTATIRSIDIDALLFLFFKKSINAPAGKNN